MTYLVAWQHFADNGERYATFFAQLDDYKAKMLMERACVVNSEDSADVIHRKLNPRLRTAEDRLLVVAVVPTECASTNIINPLCKEKPSEGANKDA